MNHLINFLDYTLDKDPNTVFVCGGDLKELDLNRLQSMKASRWASTPSKILGVSNFLSFYSVILKLDSLKFEFLLLLRRKWREIQISKLYIF